MEFELLLPEDEQPIDARTAALAQWCQGFLYGLGAGAVPDASELPGEVGEIVRDLIEISRAGVDAAQDEESNEAAYAELVEFVRVGVQLLFEELAVAASSRRPPRPRRCTERPTARMARDEFARRRRQLMRLMGRDSIAILPAAPVRHRNNDVEYAYRQDSDFLLPHGLRRARGRSGADARARAGRVHPVRARARSGA